MINRTGTQQTIYHLTDIRLYLFEGEYGLKFISCRRVNLRDVMEFHFYKRQQANCIAIITKPGHVVFVLKFYDYLQALLFLRYIYHQQVLKDPNQDPNQFSNIDPMNELKYGKEAIGN